MPRFLVIGTDAIVCLDTTAVLTCATVTANGFLRWTASDRVTTYSSVSNIQASIADPLENGFFMVRLSSILDQGKEFNSTATTAVPVNISHDGMSLTCSDGIIGLPNVNASTISIQIKRSKYYILNILM